MAYTIRNPVLGMGPIAATETTQRDVKPGVILVAEDPTYGTGEFVYLRGVASTTVGDAVVYDPSSGATTRTVAGSKGPVAFAMSANVANQWGWYQISGIAVAKVLTGFLTGVDVYLTATAGSLDDAVVAGDLINNASSASAIGTPSAGLALINIQRPFVT